MGDLGELVYVLFVVGFVVIAIVRALAERNKIEQRNAEKKDWTVEELPEETRRMLFGDPPTVAKPAQAKPRIDPFTEPRKALDEMRRQVAEQVQRRAEPPVAMPRHGAPRPQVTPPPMPQHQRNVPRPAPPLQPEFKPAPIVQHQPAPPRHAPPPQPPRMIPPQSEGRMPHEMQPQRPKPAPKPRRQQPAIAPGSRDVDEGPTLPFPTTAQRQSQHHGKRTKRWISSKGDLRRAIILSEILGPPKAMQ